MFIKVNVCFLVTIETQASSRLVGHGSQDRLYKTRIPRPYHTHGNGGWALSHGNYFLPHTNYCNVRKIEIEIVEEIKEHGHRQ